MKILAIIPACEGSATLPNKNMRVLLGKPMIYYVLRNALLSAYITDVIVTTNSTELLALARQMGVMTRRRATELCNAETSLDAVVWDVFRQLRLEDYEYVVTMQSVSPALRVRTLDNAFERMISERLDTMISVKNQAQFYWTMQDGRAAPMQSRRMNRHQLPPFYMETGAFLISKSDCIRESSRIGEKVGLYPLDGDEAVDVFSFGDLSQAENALKRQSTAIYVNGNLTIGLGHISRVLQIADELFTKPDIYYDRKRTKPEDFGETTYQLYPVDGEEGFVRAAASRDYNVIINDVLNTSKGYMEALRAAAPSARLINFEDEGPGAAVADTVVNALYEDTGTENVISGSRYYIIPKLFLIYEPIQIRDSVKNIIVTFGGADPHNYSEAVLEIAKKPEYRKYHFYMILGRAKKGIERLADCGKENISVLYDIDNMAEMMSKCDAAVSSRGRTCFELAALGIPTLSIAQHAREERHTFVCEENGFLCLPPGADAAEIERMLHQLISSTREERCQMQSRMLRHDLRNGRKNISELLQQA